MGITDKRVSIPEWVEFPVCVDSFMVLASSSTVSDDVIDR